MKQNKNFKFRVVFEPNVKFLVKSIEVAYKLVKHIQQDGRHKNKKFRLETINPKSF